MKSDCCGADIIVDADKLYRCEKCNRNSGIFSELPKWKRDTTPTEENIWQAFERVLDEHGPIEPFPIPKLTPEQVKKIRWPKKHEILETWLKLDFDDQENTDAIALVDWAIRYALQDLMPEEK